MYFFELIRLGRLVPLLVAVRIDIIHRRFRSSITTFILLELFCHCAAMSSSSAAGEAPAGAGGGGGGGGESDLADEYNVRMKRCAQEQFEVAENFLFGRNGEEKDVAKGAELLKAAGRGGLAEAQNVLGDFYFNASKGFPKDCEEAANWYRRAADQVMRMGSGSLGNVTSSEKVWTRTR